MERKRVSYVMAAKLACPGMAAGFNRIAYPTTPPALPRLPISGTSSPPLASPTTVLEVASKDHRCYVAAAVFFQDIVELCFKDGNWMALNDQIVVLCKRRGSSIRAGGVQEVAVAFFLYVSGSRQFG